jgi:hypothetical protein
MIEPLVFDADASHDNIPAAVLPPESPAPPALHRSYLMRICYLFALATF